MDSKWYLAYEDSNIVFIVDCGKDDKTVTNDAPNVLRSLNCGSKRLFYRDSYGRIDEITHQDSIFTGYKAGSPDIQAELSAYVGTVLPCPAATSCLPNCTQ
jgi:hypothetical protein